MPGRQVRWPVRSGAMPPLAAGLSARADTAADLSAALASGATVVLVPEPVAGQEPGGWLESCGKTQLAVGVAELLWQLHGVELLVWVTATTRASVLCAYAQAIVDMTGAVAPNVGEAEAEGFTDWLATARRPWLVVLDSLRDVGVMDGLWPSGPAGRVLVTTANPGAMSEEPGTVIHRVGVFSHHEALGYFRHRLGTDPAKRLGVMGLAAELGNEPLALSHASSVIADSALTCAEYRESFADRREQLPGGRLLPAAAITWELSLDHAERRMRDGSVRAVLGLAAVLGGEQIPAAVFAAPAALAFLGAGDGPVADGRAHAREALRTAERAGLISVDEAAPVAVARMNAAAQASTRAAMPPGALAHTVAVAADSLVDAWPGEEAVSVLAACIFRSCAASLHQVAGDLLWAEGCHPLLLRAGESLDRGRFTGAAVAYWEKLAATSDRILGQGHPDTLAISERLGGALLAHGQAERAIAEFRRMLAERMRVLGPDHPSALAARGRLGAAMVAAGQFGDAVPTLEEAVNDCWRVRGPDHPDTLAAQEQLAAAYYAAGQYGHAIRIYGQTVTRRERMHGPEDPGTLRARENLAGSYLADGSVRHALSQYKRALADTESAFGPGSLTTIAARAVLSSAYHTAGRMALAVQSYEQTRADYERALGPAHRDTLAVSVSLARAYHIVGRVTDAVTLLKDTVALCEALPPGDPVAQEARYALGCMTRQ
jgi:tetratricopeptide (TPR) repeat protein